MIVLNFISKIVINPATCALVRASRATCRIDRILLTCLRSWPGIRIGFSCCGGRRKVGGWWLRGFRRGLRWFCRVTLMGFGPCPTCLSLFRLALWAGRVIHRFRLLGALSKNSLGFQHWVVSLLRRWFLFWRQHLDGQVKLLLYVLPA